MKHNGDFMERVSSRVIIPPLDIPKRSQLAQGHCPFFDSSTAKTEFTEAVSISDSYYSSSDDDYDGDTHDRKLDVEVFLISRRRELQLIFACAVLQFVASATAVLMGVLSAGFFGIESLGAYAVFLAYSLVALPAIMTIIAIIVFKDHAVPLVVTAVTSTVYHGLVSVGLSVVLSVYINQGTVLAAGTDDEPGADGPTPWMFTPSYLTASCTLLGVYFVIHLVSAAPSTHFAAKVCPHPSPHPVSSPIRVHQAPCSWGPGRPPGADAGHQRNRWDLGDGVQYGPDDTEAHDGRQHGEHPDVAQTRRVPGRPSVGDRVRVGLLVARRCNHYIIHSFSHNKPPSFIRRGSIITPSLAMGHPHVAHVCR